MTGSSEPVLLSKDELRRAAERIAPYAHRTPVLTSTYFDERLGAQLFFKCENLQKIGAFKFRGAGNAVMSLSKEEVGKGVVAHSSGNHAQALALAARLRGARAWIIMPNNAPSVKVDAVRGYGAEIIFCEPTVQARQAETARVERETGATMIHPFNDRRIIAGQGTAALELIEQIESLDMLVAPVGGGGLLSGTALAAHHFAPEIEVWGAEPKEADDAFRSLQSGEIQPSAAPKTIADGLLTSLGELTFGVISRHAQGIVTVTEEEIVETMRTFWERMKMLIEPSAAVPVAALASGRLEAEGKRIGVILSGGNLDLDRLPWQ
jgi:threonine dehydratase